MATTDPSPFPLQPGTDVEVKSSFDQGWKKGFVVEDTSQNGYRLRRRSDGSVLPTAFPPDVVRPAGGLSGAWG